MVVLVRGTLLLLLLRVMGLVKLVALTVLSVLLASECDGLRRSANRRLMSGSCSEPVVLVRAGWARHRR